MGHESPIELWSPNLTTFCFAGFGTDRLRCQEAMKTAGRENPNRWGTVPRNRAHGAVGPNNSRSIVWAEKQENFQPREKCFFLTSSFIELIRSCDAMTPPGCRCSLFVSLKMKLYFRSDRFLHFRFPNPRSKICHGTPAIRRSGILSSYHGTFRCGAHRNGEVGLFGRIEMARFRDARKQ
jgi:hypothetical protein